MADLEQNSAELVGKVTEIIDKMVAGTEAYAGPALEIVLNALRWEAIVHLGLTVPFWIFLITLVSIALRNVLILARDHSLNYKEQNFREAIVFFGGLFSMVIGAGTMIATFQSRVWIAAFSPESALALEVLEKIRQ